MHVLDACGAPARQALKRKRHNLVLRKVESRVKECIESKQHSMSLTCDRQVDRQFTSDNLRPDLILYDKEKRSAQIVDLKVP